MSNTQEPTRRSKRPELSLEELEMARVAHRCIAESLDRARAATIRLTSDEGEMPSVDLPPGALRLIGEVLGQLSERKAVTVVSAKLEMTTVEAASYLHVSRPFLIREIEAGRLPHRMVGSHRRVQFDDLHAYKLQMLAGQKDALRQIAENAHDLGLEY